MTHSRFAVVSVAAFAWATAAQARPQQVSCVFNGNVAPFQVDGAIPSIAVESSSRGTISLCDAMRGMVQSAGKCAFVASGTAVKAVFASNSGGKQLMAWQVDTGSMRMTINAPDGTTEQSDCAAGKLTFDDLDIKPFQQAGEPIGYTFGVVNNSPFNVLCHIKWNGKFDDNGTLRPISESTDITISKSSENSQTWPRQNRSLVEESSMTCEAM